MKSEPVIIRTRWGVSRTEQARVFPGVDIRDFEEKLQLRKHVSHVTRIALTQDIDWKRTGIIAHELHGVYNIWSDMDEFEYSSVIYVIIPLRERIARALTALRCRAALLRQAWYLRCRELWLGVSRSSRSLPVRLLHLPRHLRVDRVASSDTRERRA